jgi:hypothetical protein
LTYYVVAQLEKGQNNLSSTFAFALPFALDGSLLPLIYPLLKPGEAREESKAKVTNYFATDYMLGTILFVYCLLFINTFYLSKLDVSRNKNLLNSKNNNTTISLSKELMNIQSADN